MRLFKSFSSNKNKSAIASVNPQTAAIIMSYGLSSTQKLARHQRINQQQTKSSIGSFGKSPLLMQNLSQKLL